MKNLFIGLFTIIIVFQSKAQQVYWNCFNIVVDNPTELVTALDAFMENTDAGKSFTPASLTEMRNYGTKYSATHQLCFFSPDPASLEANRSKLNNLQAGVLMGVWNKTVTVESSILGQSLIADPSKFNLPYSVIYSLQVSDPIAYGAAFSKMISAVEYDGAIELHEALVGAETGVTHYVVVRTKDMATWIRERNKINASKAFQDFVVATSSISNRSAVDIFSGMLVKQYNVQ